MSVLDLKSAGVLVVATACALSVGLWLNHADGRGEARGEAPTEAVSAPAQASTPTSSPPARAAARASQVVRAADGHYWAQAEIDGRAVRVLVDTGASVVALTREDALRLGMKLGPEDFRSTVNTASGAAPAARVRLRSVSVAGARVDDVEALVVEKGLTQSLLGMSYLGRLSGFEATPAALTLRP